MVLRTSPRYPAELSDSWVFPGSLIVQKTNRTSALPHGYSVELFTSSGSGRSDKSKSGRNEQENVNTLRPLNVAPLNSVPYIGPPLQCDTVHSPVRGDGDSKEAVGPAMIFLPPNSAEEELNSALAATKSGVAVAGSAATGKIGPVLGAYDIAESFDSYYFRAALPGVSRDENFSCDIEPDGNITIKGVTKTGEKIVCKHSQVFRMQSQNLCPPGHFSVSFPLPGSVNHLQFNCNFINGILEGVVKKR